MTLHTTNDKIGTMTDNYIDTRHEYFGPPDDDGLRLRTVDVWYATKPSTPEYGVVDHKDQLIPGNDIVVGTAWSLHKAGLSQILIVDRDDINGLRTLLDKIEQDFDRRDMETLSEQFSEDSGVDNSDEAE